MERLKFPWPARLPAPRRSAEPENQFVLLGALHLNLRRALEVARDALPGPGRVLKHDGDKRLVLPNRNPPNLHSVELDDHRHRPWLCHGSFPFARNMLARGGRKSKGRSVNGPEAGPDARTGCPTVRLSAYSQSARKPVRPYACSGLRARPKQTTAHAPPRDAPRLRSWGPWMHQGFGRSLVGQEVPWTSPGTSGT